MAKRKKQLERETPFKVTEAELNAVLKINSRVQFLIFDYSLAAAILGCIPPLPWISEIRFLVLIVLNLKMIGDIGAYWGYAKGQSLLATLFCLFGVFGAFAMALIAFITVYSIGILFLPLVMGWAYAAALFTLTIFLGVFTNQYYLSAKHINPETLKRSWHRQNRFRNRQKI